MSLPRVTVWAETDGPRLRYVLDWLLRERLGLDYDLISDESVAASQTYCLAYGWLDGAPSIHRAGLLQEELIRLIDIAYKDWEGLCALFFHADSPCDVRFDMLSGIFYLLSRYEEYLPFTPDRHGRYPTTESILHRHGVLERPIVDEWVEALRTFLEQSWNISIPPRPFSYRPSYDIDIAWSFRHKGLLRNLAAGVQDLVRDRKRLAQRLRVLAGREDDPYNAFVWLGATHMQYGLSPVWFFLAALQSGRFDKNISPRHPRMAALIRSISASMDIGMHPSYDSDRIEGRLREEKAVMEALVEKPVLISRQHYIRLRFPETYRALLDLGISDDYSMGYSTHFGFRAGTGSSFFWYNLAAERVSTLRVHPFPFMDTTGRFDMGLDASEAFRRLDAMAEKLVALNSSLITVMHNFSLGSDAEWAGWRSEYDRFLQRISQIGHQNS